MTSQNGYDKAIINNAKVLPPKTIVKVPGGQDYILRLDREGPDQYHLFMYTGGKTPYKDNVINKRQLKLFVEGCTGEL